MNAIKLYLSSDEVLQLLLNNTIKINTAYKQAARREKQGYSKQARLIRTAIKHYNAIVKLKTLQL